jgi:hypothetical protein
MIIILCDKKWVDWIYAWIMIINVPIAAIFKEGGGARANSTQIFEVDPAV